VIGAISQPSSFYLEFEMSEIKGVRIEKLSRAMMRRSMRLLDMEYKPSEIAEELSVTKVQVLRMLTAGAPARKDAQGHFWIHGEKFVEWLENAAPKKHKDKTTFADNECYCLQCRKIVTFVETHRRRMIVFGTCSRGHKVTRFISTKKGKKQ
jgi:hypothetical protein